jgi:hypothetical protein
MDNICEKFDLMKMLEKIKVAFPNAFINRNIIFQYDIPNSLFLLQEVCFLFTPFLLQ